MGKARKIPKRMCVGCNAMKEKKMLIRIVKNEDNNYLVDRTGKKPGRGAYICPNKECLQQAIKSKGLDRSFKEKISLEVLELLKKEFLGNENEI